MRISKDDERVFWAECPNGAFIKIYIVSLHRRVYIKTRDSAYEIGRQYGL
jgi:hypothetical protein